MRANKLKFYILVLKYNFLPNKKSILKNKFIKGILLKTSAL